DSTHRPKRDDGATPAAQPPHDPLRTNSLIESYYYIRKQIAISEESKDARTEEESTIGSDDLAVPGLEGVPDLGASPEPLSGEDAAGHVEPDREMRDAPSALSKGASIPSSLPSPPHGPTATMLDAEKQTAAATGRGAQLASPHLPKPTQYGPETMARPRPSPATDEHATQAGWLPGPEPQGTSARMPAPEDLKERRPFRTEADKEAAGRSHSEDPLSLDGPRAADGGAPEILAWLAEQPRPSEGPPLRAAEAAPPRPRRLTIGALPELPARQAPALANADGPAPPRSRGRPTPDEPPAPEESGPASAPGRPPDPAEDQSAAWEQILTIYSQDEAASPPAAPPLPAEDEMAGPWGQVKAIVPRPDGTPYEQLPSSVEGEFPWKPGSGGGWEEGFFGGELSAPASSDEKSAWGEILTIYTREEKSAGQVPMESSADERSVWGRVLTVDNWDETPPFGRPPGSSSAEEKSAWREGLLLDGWGGSAIFAGLLPLPPEKEEKEWGDVAAEGGLTPGGAPPGARAQEHEYEPGPWDAHLLYGPRSAPEDWARRRDEENPAWEIRDADDWRLGTAPIPVAAHLRKEKPGERRDPGKSTTAQHGSPTPNWHLDELAASDKTLPTEILPPSDQALTIEGVTASDADLAAMIMAASEGPSSPAALSPSDEALTIEALSTSDQALQGEQFSSSETALLAPRDLSLPKLFLMTRDGPAEQQLEPTAEVSKSAPMLTEEQIPARHEAETAFNIRADQTLTTGEISPREQTLTTG
ncbi:hypothetical protein scyTo_0024373, partial [Scyliorhinus torazame]|nr:hypothetical protein [Scyliorhinus torazame]